MGDMLRGHGLGVYVAVGVNCYGAADPVVKTTETDYSQSILPAGQIGSRGAEDGKRIGPPPHTQLVY